jgi:excisionase family DNA binding protein
MARDAGGAIVSQEQIQRIAERIADKLLTAEEAAAHMGLKVATIRRMTYMQELPCVHPTGKRAVRYRLSDLEALLRMRSQPARVGGER